MPFLRNPVPPRLPDPENDYNPRFMAALLQTLRLFFEQLTSAVNNVLGVNGGAYVQSPFGVFSSAVSQTIASATTAYPVTFGATDLSSGVALSALSRLTVDSAGVYRVALLAQLANPDASLRQASIWLRVNGVDVAASRSEYSINGNHGSFDGYLAIEFSRTISLQAKDYVELVWSAETTTVRLGAIAAGTSPTRPTSPSALATVTYASHL